MQIISKDGITWTLDRPYPAGRFANGDFWVVGPVNVLGISPSPANGLHGSMVNPDGSMEHAYDSRTPYYYNASKGFLPPNQLAVNSSLVSTESYATPPGATFTNRAAVLTVLPAPPPPDALRPAYAGTTKTIYRLSDLNFDALPALAPPPGIAIPSLTHLEDKTERLWLDHRSSWARQQTAPGANMENYGQAIANVSNEALVRVMLSDPLEDRVPLAINLAQLGIDYYGAVQSGSSFYPNGGHSSGRKGLLTFFAFLLSDQTVNNAIAQLSPGRFGETGQTYIATSGTGYTGATALMGFSHADDLNNDVEQTDPSTWRNASSGGNNNRCLVGAYRFCCTSTAWVGTALSAKVLGTKYLFDPRDAFFAYIDRWMTEDPTPWVSTIMSACSATWSWPAVGRVGSSDFVTAMWQHYAHLYP